MGNVSDGYIQLVGSFFFIFSSASFGAVGEGHNNVPICY